MEPKPDRRPRHRRQVSARRRIGSLLATALLLGGIPGLVKVGIEASRPSPLWDTEQTQPDNLPGAQLRVDQTERDRLIAAAVKLARHHQGTPLARESQYCSGTKVSHKGVAYILSAAHCFRNDIEGLHLPGGLPQAVNITSRLGSLKHVALDLHLPNDHRLREPLATIQAVAVDRSGEADMALLSVTDTSPAFREKPAIPLTSLAYGSKPLLIVGQQVTLYSATESSRDEPIVTTGVYLGRRTGIPTNGWAQRLDLVGISPNQPSEDACGPGASGSSAAYAERQLSGPLAVFNNYKYPTPTPTPMPSQAVLEQRATRQLIEVRTGLETDRFATVCGFSVVPSPDAIGHLVHALNDPAYRYPG